jgi:alpha-amylase
MKTTFRLQRGFVMLSAALLTACGGGGGSQGYQPGQPLTLQVGAAFPAGTTLRDHVSGQTTTVASDGSVTVTPAPSGVVLLERAGAAATPFRWKNATVYFAITDRFQNGDPSNDASYGRLKDGQDEVGTWHGGDLKGLTARLDHLASLGVTALWISPTVEQVHGWVSGGTGDFKHYGYHGYWALDFTRLDKNFGTPADLTELVDQAHLKGIRVVLDIVMNHPGYATGDDLLAYLPQVFKDGTGAAFRSFQPMPGQTWDSWNGLVNYSSTSWSSWWSKTWIRAGFPGFPSPGSDDLTRSLAYLPDFITEGTVAAGFPGVLAAKAATPDGTGAVELPGATVRTYLTTWHADWVRQYGIDGFRCDTAKHVELASWRALKDAATTALADWKLANPLKKLDDAPFWMTGEVFPHGVEKDAYYTDGGFDSLINFSFQGPMANLLATKKALVDDPALLEGIYDSMAAKLAPDPTFDALTYLSSHDTLLFFDSIGQDPARQRQAGTALLLAPGGVQLFYGDESGRKGGPSASDQAQATRSDMNWGTFDASILSHFQQLGTFRQRHAAIGAGVHHQLTSPAGTYAFSRILGAEDAVVVALTRPR